jgi:hypothetical protein
MKMNEQLIAYVDLLGFKSVIADDSEERREKILTLLSELAESIGDFKYDKIVSEAYTDHTIRPAISAFSDNIIFSFPIQEIVEIGSGPVVFHLLGQIATIFFGSAQSRLFGEGRCYGWSPIPRKASCIWKRASRCI